MSGEHELRAALQAVRACRLPGQTVMGIHGPCETGEGWSISGLTALVPQIDAALATPSPSTDTLERRKAIAGKYRLAEAIVDHGGGRSILLLDGDSCIETFSNGFDQPNAETWAEARGYLNGLVAGEMRTLTTSPRIEPIAVATTWSGSATIGDPAMPKVDSAFSISRRRHEDRFATSPRVDEGRALRREGIVAFSADIENPRVLKLHFDQDVTSAHRSLILDAINARRAAIATTPADPRVGKMEADLEAAKKALAPFAAKVADIGDDESDVDLYRPAMRHNEAPNITVGDIRRASSTLSQIEGSGKCAS